MSSANRILLWPNGAPGALGDEFEDQPAITPYLVKSVKPVSAVVVCPGGGYSKRAPHEAEPIALWLNSLGMAAVVLQYRVAPYQYPCALQDAQQAMRMVRHRADEWGIDPARVGIMGFSAGGHLASTVGTHFHAGLPGATPDVAGLSCRPDFMILCYPVITLDEQYTHKGSLQNLLGVNPPVALREFLSNEKQVTPDTPPAFLWHTADDPAVPVENSLAFAAALRHNRVPCALHVFTSGRHGLGLAAGHPEVEAWPDLCAAWLQNQGFAERPAAR